MSAAVANPVQGLADLVGVEHARMSEQGIAIAPANTRELAEVMRFAAEHGLTVVATGGGTKLGWGNPVEATIRLDLRRMNALREHAWQDMTCTVEAGCSWATMQTALAQYGQMVALDPLWPARASVGGIVSTNDSGALRLKYGGLRDLIIGMTVVLADGTIAKTGGKVVKNVAGYDLHKLMCGSFGTLGVIVEVNFRLHPLEQQAQTWTVTAPDASLLDAPLRALLDSQMAPTSIQVRTSDNGFALDLRIASLPECLAAHLPQIERMCGTLAVQEGSDDVWQMRQRLFDRENSVVLKISMLPSEIAAILGKLRASAGVEVECVAQATGLATVAIRAGAEATATLLARLRDELRGTGGSVMVLQMPDALRGRFDVWGDAPDTLPLMREIKRRFDPERILSPGRFVGGI
jgi:glycolate oxidase FAD binding subunit